MEELEHVERDGRGAGSGHRQLVEPEALAQAGEEGGVGAGDGGFEVGRHRVPRVAQPHKLEPGGDRRVRGLAALGGQPREGRLDARPELLPDSRRGDQQMRAHLGQIARDLPRVGTRRGLEALGQRQRVVQDAVHHVRRREPGDDPPHVRDRQCGLPAAHRRHHAGVRELDALGVRRGPRRVDERHHVGGLERGGRRREVDRLAAGLERVERGETGAGRVVEYDDMLDPRGRGALQQVEQRGLDHHDPSARVADDVLDVVRRQRRVQRAGRRAAHRHGEVGHPQLRPVGRQQRHRVAAPDAELAQAAGRGRHAPGQLLPGQRGRVVERAEGDVAGATRDGVQEGVGDGRGAAADG